MPMDKKRFVQEKVEVEDRDKRAVYGPGGPASEPEKGSNVFLAGLALSGKATVGRLAAEALGMSFVDAREAATPEAMEPILAGNGQVVALAPEALAHEAVRAGIARAGRVFYLMADVPLVMARMKDREGQVPALVRAQLANDLNEFEPLAMSIAGFILQAAKPAQELADDIVEKLRLFT